MDGKKVIKNLINKLNVSKKGKEVRPHKYLFILSVANLFDIQNDHKNMFTYDELEPLFLRNFNNYFDKMPDYRKMMEHPFYYLQNDGFWFLQLKTGKEQLFNYYQQKKRLTKKRIQETVEYAFVDTEVYNLLRCSSYRKMLQNEIDEILKGISFNYEDTDSDVMKLHEKTSLYKHEKDAIDTMFHSIKSNNLGKILSNVLLYESQSNNYYEIDLLLVTNFGIFVIELKHWTGHIKIEPHNWVVNNFSYRADPHKINSFKSKLIKGIYQHRFKVFPNLWVESVVFITNPDVTVEGAASPGIAVEQKLSNLTFSSIEDFITYLKKKRASNKKQILDDQQVDAVINYFATLDKPKQSIKYIVPGYETVEYISQKPECIELIARPLQGHGKGLYRFRIFRPPENVPQKEKERFNKKAYNTIQSVAQIGDHPHIHKVWVIQNDLGDIIEGSEWSETGTLRDLILNNNHAFQAADALNICCGIAQALNEAHKAGVIHRAVKPENILMMNDIPKLMNFDLAYQLEDNRLTVIEDAAKLKDDGYIAPDIIFNQDIDESTDFFSLCVIAYELLTGE